MLGATEGARRGRLSARPQRRGQGNGVGTGTGTDLPVPGGVLRLPDRQPRLLRLVVLFHGAGGTAQHGVDLLGDQADEHGLALLALPSVASTWDVITGGYGPDVSRLDETLHHVFDLLAVDTVAVGGFSDGASYALSIGVANGDLFSSIVAFSPGFLAPAAVHGRPRIHVTHGVRDTVLPVDRCGRRVVAQLRRAGYDVDYREFDGGHVVTPEHRAAAARWLVAD